MPVLPSGQNHYRPFHRLKTSLSYHQKNSRPDDHIRIQEDGSRLNTQTGEITIKSEPKFKPFSAASDSTGKEIEQLRLEQQKENLPEWMRQNQVKGEKI